MKTINVTAGPRNELVVGDSDGSPAIQVGSSAFGGILPEQTLPITINGQTRWNVGGLEPRRTLYLNGQRQKEGVDFTVNLPYINWISTVPLEPSDLVVLAF